MKSNIKLHKFEIEREMYEPKNPSAMKHPPNRHPGRTSMGIAYRGEGED